MLVRGGEPRFASAVPERVRKLVFFGGYVSRRASGGDARLPLVEFTRLNWTRRRCSPGSSSRTGSRDDIGERGAASSPLCEREAAAAFLELELTADARPHLPGGTTMPSLVLHRRGDRTVRSATAASSPPRPECRFVALGGDAHLPWMDEQRELHRALAGFLDDTPSAESNGESPLSRRESEVLRLVAAGLSNREIPLSSSASTVHRHVANILRAHAVLSRRGRRADPGRVHV